MERKTRVLVFYVNYGPYHLARARALLGMEEVEPIFLELASCQKSHPWMQEQAADVPLRTLFQQPFEEIKTGEARRRTLQALHELQPDVVVVAGYGLPFMRTAAGWAMKNKRPSVLLFETARQDRKRNPLREAFKRALVKRLFDSALVGGKAHREYLAELGFPEEWMWEPHSVVDNAFFVKEKKSVLSQDPRVWTRRLGVPDDYFLYVGRLAGEKNVMTLLQAYEVYRRRHKDGWGLVVLGDGPLRGALTRWVEERNVPQVVFPGFLPTSGTAPYYALARVFVLPSLVEPWGLVVNEAMASGLPVMISNRCGSAPDLVSPSNGWLFDPLDWHGLGDLLESASLLPDEERARMGEASLVRVAQYSPERWAEGLMAAVRGARSRRRG